jgi:hypothetical protein
MRNTPGLRHVAGDVVGLSSRGDDMATVIRRRAATRSLARRPSMPGDLTSEQYSSPRSRLEGLSLALSGTLFLAKALFDIKAGEPPSGGAELVAWQVAEKATLALTNEILFFAVILLIPGVIGLYRSLAGFDPRKAAWGCGLVAVIIPVMMALTIVHGRLAFPVYDIDLSDPTVTQLVVSLYYGGQHAVGLLFGVATVLLALAMRRAPYGRAITVLGLATAIADVAGAYPWLIGPGWTSASEVLFAGWFVAAGVRLAGSDFRRAALTAPAAAEHVGTAPRAPVDSRPRRREDR